jgi:8-oxo-dGTP diphosphatase
MGVFMQKFLEIFKEKEAKRFKLKVGVFAFVTCEDDVLLLRRFQTGTEDGMYVLPMGGHDGNEPLTTSIIREAKEEVNIDIQKEHLTVCHVMHRRHLMPDDCFFEQVDVFFRTTEYAGTLHNNEPDKCDDVSFFSLNALPENTAPFIKKALFCISKGQFYSEFGWE